MIQQLVSDRINDVFYPESDGQLMADNTKQFRWIVVIKENLELLFAEVEDVFVAGDLLWYPVQGDPKIRQAPDVMVVVGRHKGDRGSYQQWEENNISPQVVFEILSPGNRVGEMLRKLSFYERYGVEEYYIYDPDRFELTGLLRNGDGLELVDSMENWVSPRLQIQFQPNAETLKISRPDGDPFLTYVELAQQRDIEKQRADRAIAALTQEQQRAAALEAQLKALGVEPYDR